MPQALRMTTGDSHDDGGKRRSVGRTGQGKFEHDLALVAQGDGGASGGDHALASRTGVPRRKVLCTSATASVSRSKRAMLSADADDATLAE